MPARGGRHCRRLAPRRPERTRAVLRRRGALRRRRPRSLASLARPNRRRPVRSATRGEASMIAERARFLDAASRIGRRLCRDAVWHRGPLQLARLGDGAAWRAMGQRLSSDGRLGLRRRGGNRPLPGASCAPQRRSHHRDDRRRRAGAGPDRGRRLVAAGEYGFYSGLSGVARCCVEAGTALGRDDLVTRGRAAMLACAKLAPRPQRLDVINGSAGLIPALIEAAAAFRARRIRRGGRPPRRASRRRGGANRKGLVMGYARRAE